MWFRTTARLLAGLLAVAAALAAGGCSRAIGGTPVATPGQAGIAIGGALLDTTCREYVAMGESSRREVIVAIGEDGNQLVATSPDLWVGVGAALCTFADPSAPIRDVITGGIR